MKINYSYLFLSILLVEAIANRVQAMDEKNHQSIKKSNLLEYLNKKKNILLDKYKVDIYLNNYFIQRMKIDIKDKSNTVKLCLFLKNLNILGLKDNYIQIGSRLGREQQYFYIQGWIKNSQISPYQSNLSLDLSIPQLGLLSNPRGYINLINWDSGSIVAFIKHIYNYYYNCFNVEDNHSSQDSAYVSLNGGINIVKLQ